MYLYIGVGVIGIGSIYRGGRYWYTVLVQEHKRMGGLSKSV